MSMEEIDQAMMDMVNGKQESDYPSVACGDSSPDKGSQESEEVNRVVNRFELLRKIRMAAWALVCIAAAAALIAAQYVPAVLPWVLKIGTVIFIVAGAIIIDRGFVRWLV